jgi:hypothetical protein
LAGAKLAFATGRQNGADCERRFQVSNQAITGSGGGGPGHPNMQPM